YGNSQQLLVDLGIGSVKFKPTEKGGLGSSVFIKKDYFGEIEVLNSNIVDFELDFEVMVKNANLKKIYQPLAKYPPVIEDLALVVKNSVSTEQIIEAIYRESELIKEVSLLDEYAETKTFHIIYQNPEKNLTNEEVTGIRKNILIKLQENFEISLKS
ncbi:MAG: hypothetical protein M1365_08750, partial [Actinobacteria bacterium]|nr:hypothetical protein [Actinomycetota bacterium]